MDGTLLMSETDKTPRIVIPFSAHPAPTPKDAEPSARSISPPNLSSRLLRCLALASAIDRYNNPNYYHQANRYPGVGS
ncbi:MAG: hypothetical protein RKR03_12170 [Candidatus Competibacter sp.]|nr:hypothetical protein [Candidatus Competibacter sp.]